MNTIDEVIIALKQGQRSSIFDDALHYLKAYKQLSSALLSENIEIREEGIYCKVCGSRLDKDLELEDENAG